MLLLPSNGHRRTILGSNHDGIGHSNIFVNEDYCCHSNKKNINKLWRVETNETEGNRQRAIERNKEMRKKEREEFL